MERFKTLIKVQPFKFGIPKCPKYKEYTCMSKIHFKALLALSSVDDMSLVTPNIVSPNKLI